MAKIKTRSTESRRQKPLVVTPRDKTHTHTVILLHDAGAKGRDAGREFLKATNIQSHFPTVRFVFPCAFKAPPAVKNGPSGATQWFNNPSWPSPRRAGDTATLPETAVFLQRLIHSEARLLRDKGDYGLHAAYGRVVVGGLSHGGAAALLYLLGSHRPLGGFLGIGALLPWKYQLELLLEMYEDGFGRRKAIVGTNYVRDLLQFERLAVGNEGYRSCENLKDAEKDNQAARMPAWQYPLIHLNTPAFLGHGSQPEKENSMGRCLGGIFGMDVIDIDCTEHGKEWYSVPEAFEHVLSFLEQRVGIHRASMDETSSTSKTERKVI